MNRTRLLAAAAALITIAALVLTVNILASRCDPTWETRDSNGRCVSNMSCSTENGCLTP